MPDIDWFATCFPGRRSDRTVVEVNIRFTQRDPYSFPQHASEIGDLLLRGGILSADQEFPFRAPPKERRVWYGSLLSQTALLLQQKAGHRVGFYGVKRLPDEDRCLCVVEHEHCDVGMSAVKLAAELMSGKRRELAEPFRVFERFAAERVLPADTAAIIEAAERRDIPAIKLERQPHRREMFDQLTGGECIRRNGLLMLGHGARQRVLDGTMPLDGSDAARALRRDRARRAALLERLGLPQCGNGDGGGERHALIVVNDRVTAAVRGETRDFLPLDAVHDSIVNQAAAVGREAGGAPVAVILRTADISRPLGAPGSGVEDFEPAPRLDEWLGPESPQLGQTAREIVDWLFPGREPARMPVIAVTGTNGKTTTTRMINQVMAEAGRRTGLVCTTGVYLDGRQIASDDQCSDTGHLKVLTSREVDFAVLETHHLGIIFRGFAYGHCDIGVCLNVTEDHLDTSQVDTVEQMAEIKSSVPNSARRAVVLNADDPHCLAMLDGVTAQKACLVSMRQDPQSLASPGGRRPEVFCVLEQIDGESWMVLHEGGRRLPVMPVAEIPATFGGTAEFNVSNALHAAAACRLAGAEAGHIRSALAAFQAGYESNPGRMNVIDDLPFRVILDFAHNPDGLRRLSEFVDRQDVSGRRMIAFAGGRKKDHPTLKKMAAALAGHYDFYFCRDYGPFGQQKSLPDIAPVLRAGLLEAGVPEQQTAVVRWGKEVVFDLLDGCRTGDLLVLVVGYLEQHDFPGYIEEYAGEYARKNPG